MSCTYASVEIQRTPELRVFKKCLFYDKPCTEVRAAKMCPLLKRAAAGRPPAPTVGLPTLDKDVLSDELRRIDSLPVTGGVIGQRATGGGEAPKKIEKAQPKGPSDAELLKAELSDFISKLEAKQEKPTPEARPVLKRAVSKRTTPKRTTVRKRNVKETT